MAALQTTRLFAAAALLSGCNALLVGAPLASNVSAVGGDQLLQVKQLVVGRNCVGGWNAINPSFVPLPSGDFAVAFRGLCMTKKGGHASWYSKLVIGHVAAAQIRGPRSNFQWKSLELAPDPRFYGDKIDTKVECAMPGLDTAEGPEDPRLVHTHNGVYIIVTGYDLADKAAGHGHHPPTCQRHGMLLYAAKVESLSPPRFHRPAKLTFDGMGMVEKNWAMFTPTPSEGSKVNAVYSIHPHKIVAIDLYSGHVKFTAETKSEAVAQLAKKLGVSPSQFHGGSGVAYVRSEGHGFYLSILHLAVEKKTGGTEYWNFPYKFEAKHPYKILHVGKKLPLTLAKNPAYGEMVAFVTTLMVDTHDVFVGYGSGDRASRTWRIPFAEFDHKYFPSTTLLEDDGEIAEELEELEIEQLAPATPAPQCETEAAAGCSDDLAPSVCRSCRASA